ncbi:MAG: hypothetical protein ACOY3V_10020 [Pseudomonadota bacterium]
MDKFVGFVLLLLLMSMCQGQRTTTSVGPEGTTTTTTTTSINAGTFIKKIVKWLEIADFVQGLFEAENKIIAQPQNSMGQPVGNLVEFYPIAFVERHDIQDEMMAKKVAYNIENNLRECTQMALDTGHSSDRLLREARISCLYGRGFDENDMAYTRIKHPDFWI